MVITKHETSALLLPFILVIFYIANIYILVRYINIIKSDKGNINLFVNYKYIINKLTFL